MDEQTYSTLEQIKLGITLVGAIATTAVAVHSLYQLVKEHRMDTKDASVKVVTVK